jgi:single-strand DNA-binding protein
MRDVNKIILVGRLGADPIERTTTQGTAVVHFPLATQIRGKKMSEAAQETEEALPLEAEREGEKENGKEDAKENAKEETQWHRVVVWGKQGQACAQYLKKGNAVFIEGSVKSRKFDGADGKSRYSFEVHAESVSFLSGLKKASTSQSAQASH